MPASFPEVSPRSRVFFGRFGLRAGYGIAIFLAVFLLLQAVAGIAEVIGTGQLPQFRAAQAYAQTHPHTRPSFSLPFVPALVISGDGVLLLGLLFLCWLLARAERRPFRAYGLGRYRAADILPGAFWGLGLMSLLIFTLHAGHLLVFEGRALSTAPALLYGFKWLLAFLIVGLFEEYAFRGYLQYTLMRGLWGLAERLSPADPRPVAFWLAAGALSLLFAAMHGHNSGENRFGLVQVVLAGVVFSYALWRTGSLWWGVGFHLAWDWAQSFLFGVADSGSLSIGRLYNTHPQGSPLLSGGSAGPEGSIFATAALLLTFVIIRLTTRPGIQPALEQQLHPAESTLRNEEGGRPGNEAPTSPVTKIDGPLHKPVP